MKTININLDFDILSKYRDLSEMTDVFDLALDNYKLLIENTSVTGLGLEFIESSINSELSNTVTVNTQKIENIDIDANDIVVKKKDGSWIENLRSFKYYSMYKDYELSTTLTVKDIKHIHNVLNTFDRSVKPGLLRNSRTNPTNVRISNSNIVFPHYKVVEKELNELLDYYNNGYEHPIVKSALIHLFLVSIHPFNDGNGRLSRFISDKFLERHLGLKLYLAEAIYNTKPLYYKLLNEFATTNDPLPFIKYIIKSAVSQMRNNGESLRRKINEVNLLSNKIKDLKSIKDKYAPIIANLLITDRQINNSTLSLEIAVTKATASSIIEKLIKGKIIDKGTKEGSRIYYLLIS